MTAWPDTDGSAITRYLRQLRLRSPTGQTHYRQVLRGCVKCERLLRHQPP